MDRGADEPQFQVFDNAARRGLVYVGIGTGVDGYNITPARAETLAAELLDAARQARGAGG
jgi:hypothetical protein